MAIFDQLLKTVSSVRIDPMPFWAERMYYVEEREVLLSEEKDEFLCKTELYILELGYKIGA